MADGLFSYQTPGQLQQEYLSNLIQPVGGGNLYSQLVQTMSNAGRMMGYGAGRMFGGQVPGEAKNAAIQSVFEQVKDIQDPAQQYTAASQLFLKAGFPDLAMQARKTAQTQQLTGLQLKEAERKEAEAQAAQEKNKAREVALQAAFAKGASDKEILSIYTQYASPDVAFKGINDRIAKQQALEAKAEETRLARDDRLERMEQEHQNRLVLLQTANASREAIAAESRRGREEIARWNIASREATAKERIAANLQQAKLVAELRNKNMPKDAAEAVASIDAIQATQANGMQLIARIDKPEVSEDAFTNYSAVKHWINAQRGIATDESILVEDARTWIREQVNTILQAAKGVQTEGDAQRAEGIIALTTGKLTKKGMLNAIQKVIKFGNDVSNRQDRYVFNRTGRNYIPTAASTPPDIAGIRN